MSITQADERVRPATSLPAFARTPVLATSGLTALLLVLAGTHTPYFFDELYYIAAGSSRNLSWGYMDQPPLVPLLAGMNDHLAPGSLLLLRLPSTLAAAAMVVVAALIARELGGDRAAQLLAAASVATSAAIVGASYLATAAIDPLWWTLIVWVVARWARLHRAGVRADHLLVAAAGITVVSLQTKYLVPALWAGILLGALVCGPRALPRQRVLWVAGGIAALTTIPTLVWQATHGWPYVFRMAAMVHNEWVGGPQFVTDTLLYCGILGFWVILIGIVRVLWRPQRHPAAFLAVGLLVVAVAFGLNQGRVWYEVETFPSLMAIGAVETVALARQIPRWLSYPLGAFVVLSSLMSTLLWLPVGAVAPPASILRTTADATLERYRSLPADERDHTAVLAADYAVAAAVDVLGRRAGGPSAYSADRGYGYFAQPPATADRILWVGLSDPPAGVRFAFTECRAQPQTEELRFWDCTGRTTPWTAVWPTILTNEMPLRPAEPRTPA